MNATTKLKATPLIAAANQGHAAIVNLLLSSGADCSMSVDGMTALMLAKRAGKKDVVALIEASGNPKKPVAFGERRGVWSGRLGQID